MNFLAHLHLATLAESSLLGNLMADFVRGDPDTLWDSATAEGIRLHRRLDSLTDALPEVRAARLLFREETRRVAPITLDVIWDHFLARHWDHYCPATPLSLFCRQAEQQIRPFLPDTPDAFRKLNQLMWPERWLEKYGQPERLALVLNGMANRRPKLDQLRHSYQDFVENYSALDALFSVFYPRLMQLATEKRL
ncbi:ACP phosphodiesterase [Tatumella terrea]|uniref:ACP phosphodiesterase n=1 Tax=Tatumella terrea TaxID=419007 RepID=A0ABW1VWW5_9GAMM